MNPPLFVYGSMRDADVRALVLGSDRPEVRTEPAWMPGATAARVPGESYPHLVASEGVRAPGEVLYGLGETCLDRIRFFEGDEYALFECEVERASGELIAAVYFGGVAIPPAPVVAWSLEVAVSLDGPEVHGGVAARHARGGRGVVAAHARRGSCERRRDMSVARCPSPGCPRQGSDERGPQWLPVRFIAGCYP